MARVSHGLTQGDDYVLNTDNDVGLSACLALLHRQQNFWFSIKFKSQCDKTYQNLHRSISFLLQYSIKILANKKLQTKFITKEEKKKQ